MLKLGSNARDVISGIRGILTQRVQSLTGPDRYCLTTSADEKGHGSMDLYFDEDRIEVSGARVKLPGSAS